MTRIPVHATQSTNSPLVGHYEPVKSATDIDWDTGETLATTTVYKAYLTDGTEAGRPLDWGHLITPRTNVYDTEAKARAGIRRAHRHLAALATQIADTAKENSR